MEERGVILDFASYAKKVRPDAKQEVVALLQQVCHPAYAQNYLIGPYRSKPPAPAEDCISIRASVSMHRVPKSGSIVKDFLRMLLGQNSRYELIIMKSGTLAGRRIEKMHWYPFYSADEVYSRIDCERDLVYGKGEFYFQNHTGELDGLFIDLTWIAAK